jgi:hypothetical protein
MSIPKLEIAPPRSICRTQRCCSAWIRMRRLKALQPNPRRTNAIQLIKFER